MNKGTKELKEEFYKYFDEAELRIKHGEEITKNIDIVPVNQLRYAGRHLANFLNLSNKNIKIEELEKGINHCKRSIYDSNSIIIKSIEIYHQWFRIEYKNVVLKNFLLDYQEQNVSLKKAVKLIEYNSYPEQYGNNCNVGEEVNENFDEIQASYQVIKNFKESLISSMDDINADINNRKQKHRISVAMFLIGIV